MGEDAKMPKELEKFEDYYMRTMEITGSRDNFPKDPQLVKDVINLFLQQNPRVSQVDIATEFELSSSLFSRFLRTDNVKSKPEWNRVAYILGLNIDLARYIKDTRKLIELVGDWQLIYYGSRLTCFVRDTFDIDGDIVRLLGQITTPAAKGIMSVCPIILAQKTVGNRGIFSTSKGKMYLPPT